MTDEPNGKPAADSTFEADDAKLTKELGQFHREREGAPGDEFPHDETYKPGYHEGGTRFGFFPDAAAAKSDAAPKKKD